MSSGSEGEHEVLKRQLSLRASQRLSAKRRDEKVSKYYDYFNIFIIILDIAN